MRKIPVIALALVLLLLLSYIPFPSEAASTKIKTQINGPTSVITGGTYKYTVTIIGAPDADRWGCKVNVSEGGKAVPENYTSNTSSTFSVSIQSPVKEGEFTITVNGTADIGNTTYWNKVEYKVKAVQPYVVTATIYNSGEVDANNVSVSLFADGKFQYTATVSVPSGKSSTATLKWNPTGFSDGVHTLEIRIDPSSNLTFEGGKAVLIKQVYIGPVHEDKTGIWIALAILFGAGAVYALFSYRSKKKRMPKRKKW